MSRKRGKKIEMRTWASAAVIVLAAVAVGCSSARLPAEPSERTVDLAYNIAIRGLPAQSEKVSVWAPMPLSDRWQQLEGFHVEGDRPYSVVADAEYGNRFIRIDLSGASDAGGTENVAITFRVNRKAADMINGSGEGKPGPQIVPARFLMPDRLVPIDGRIAEEAKEVAGDVADPLDRTRKLYDHVVDSVVYDKSGQGWGRGDALYVCNARTGNCTDFHSLFIGEVRALGTPARFVMGLPLPPGEAEGTIPGYHCWAEFYIEGRGWMPIDASEASKRREKRDALFGRLDANRIAFTIGRDIRIPGALADPVNYVIYPHVEIDGKTGGNVETSFQFREVDVHKGEG